jgi:aldehyde:ferredoxin oxidoreductase
MECQMLEAATGIKMTEEELWAYCMRSKNLFRAILIRNHSRTREMEVSEAYTPLQYPDAEGLTVTRAEYEDLVDLYYEQWGWDKKTGWPTRETYEKYGLGEVADELEALGKLP